MKVFIKILKVILGIVLGLVSSFLIVFGLEALWDTGLIGVDKEYDLSFGGDNLLEHGCFCLYLLLFVADDAMENMH